MRSCRAATCTPLTMRLGAGDGSAEGRGGGSSHWSRVGKRWEGFVLVDLLLLLLLHTAGLSWHATQLWLNVIIAMPENANNASAKKKSNHAFVLITVISEPNLVSVSLDGRSYWTARLLLEA